ncbi:hypothetical protein [Nonomuraea dietziae]|uniref:hypothetical protein n=1 Tax=Nonomuraea dietziae TaxID=65515 RepID=UPI0031E1E84E
MVGRPAGADLAGRPGHARARHPAVVDGEDQAAEAEPPRPSRRPAGSELGEPPTA